MKKWISYCLILAAGTLLLFNAMAAKTAGGVAAVLEVKGAIGPATQDFIEQGLKKASSEQARVIVFQLDTPGGLSKSMRGIIKAILASPIPVISYVAPSGARAASAGTYILYASHIAAMAPGTNLGAATPVNLGSPNSKDNKQSKQQSASQLKAINDSKAYIRSLAQLRGRNVQWAENAVSQAASLSAQEALKKNVINLIAKDIPTLLNKIDGQVVQLVNKKEVLQTKNLVIKNVKPNWRTRFLSVITDPSIAYILLMAGFYGLFFEFMNPGYVLPGVTGAICLLVALYALQLLPINYVGLGLIILGLIFIVAEAFLPSFGALGIGGVIAFVIGSVMLIRADIPGFGIPWELIAGIAVISLLFFLGVLQLALRARRRKIVSGAEAMIGQQGRIVFRDGEVWVFVMSELWKVKNPEHLSDGQVIIVEAIEGLSLRVKPKE